MIWRYSVASNVKWKIFFSNFVAFSEYLNFTDFMDCDDISCMSLCIMPFISLAAKQWKKLKHGRLIAVPVKKRDIR